jgi:hypothetical protein
VTMGWTTCRRTAYERAGALVGDRGGRWAAVGRWRRWKRVERRRHWSTRPRADAVDEPRAQAVEADVEVRHMMRALREGGPCLSRSLSLPSSLRC